MGVGYKNEYNIALGSVLIHDGETANNKLIRELQLKSVVHPSKDTNGLLDKEKPMYPINHAHVILKHLLTSHGSFKREDLQS